MTENKFFNHLAKYKQSLEAVNTWSERAIYFDLMISFRQFLSNAATKTFVNKIQAHPDFNYYHRYFHSQTFGFCYGVEFEKANAAQKYDFKTYLKTHGDYLDSRFEHYDALYQGLKIKPGTRYTMVGVGAFPDSFLVMTNLWPRVDFTALDINPAALFKAQEVLRLFNINRVRIDVSSPLLYDYADSDVVLVSDYVPSKVAVMNQILKTARSNVEIQVMCPVGPINFLAEDVVPEKLSPQIRFEGEFSVFGSYSCTCLKNFSISK